jgi:hypothetical protein
MGIFGCAAECLRELEEKKYVMLRELRDSDSASLERNSP